MEVQEKILRVVEYGVFERVGSSESIEVDVRIIAATNADLMALAAEGRFKQDLLDRLSFEVLFLPTLSERKEDIIFLAFTTRLFPSARTSPYRLPASDVLTTATSAPLPALLGATEAPRTCWPKSRRSTTSTMSGKSTFLTLISSPADAEPRNFSKESSR